MQSAASFGSQAAQFAAEASDNFVAASLMDCGIARRSFNGVDAFISQCETLGEILSVADVALIPNSHRHVSTPGSIPFHSDGPAADVVAWFCVEQDDEAGHSILTDAIPLLRKMTAAQRAQLRSISLPYFDHSQPGRPAGFCALLRGDGEALWRFNYAPWLLPELSEQQKAAVSVLDKLLSKAAETSFLLSPGQSLFIDNWRILHARGALKPNSKRHLKRVWLRTSRRSRMDYITLRPS